MYSAPSLSDLENPGEFIPRHIGIDAQDEARMLAAIGETSREALLQSIVPPAICRSRPMALPPAVTEAQALAELKAIAGKNQVLKSFIGQGYYGTHTPGVILRNILENPAWYTAYTPYQAEISQGRMEALVNFQTMVTDLTGMAIANASMLDEATAAAEAMTLAKRSVKSKRAMFLWWQVTPTPRPSKSSRPAPRHWASPCVWPTRPLNGTLPWPRTFSPSLCSTRPAAAGSATGAPTWKKCTPNRPLSSWPPTRWP